MPSAGFVPTIPEIQEMQTYTSDSKATSSYISKDTQQALSTVQGTLRSYGYHFNLDVPKIV
jgi:hypothetical protein